MPTRRKRASVLFAASLATGSLLLPACSSEEDCARTLTCAPAGGSATGSGPGGGGQSEDGGSGGGGEAGGGASGGRASAGGTSGGGPGGIGGETQGCGMGCAGAAAYCDEEAGACMECRKDEDCGEQLCDVALGECVECKESAHCTDARAPTCEEGECVGCEQPGDCTHLPATPACEPTTGECVQCVSAADCGGKVCDPVSHTCTELPAGDTGACGTCEYDAECREGMLCVEQSFGDEVVGNFCTWTKAARVGAEGSCSVDGKPYGGLGSAMRDGRSVDLCVLRHTTCPGLLSYSTSCADENDDASCGAPGLPDALCEAVESTYLCTHPCGNDNDCRLGTCAPLDGYCSL